jgi:SAM-dependent methyltransferase
MVRWSRFGIGAGERVLDVGCGLRPFVFASHLADLHMRQEWRGRRIGIPTQGRPFVRCSVEALPFKDRAFDFVYCAHVLEHVRDPARACRELVRVARRGYIECPRSWLEILSSADDHRWLVDCEGGVLIFREKLLRERGDPAGLRYKFLEWSGVPRFMLRWRAPRTHAVFNVEFSWEERLRTIVLTREQRLGRGSGRPRPRRHDTPGLR